jgi:hypothetical protein
VSLFFFTVHVSTQTPFWREIEITEVIATGEKLDLCTCTYTANDMEKRATFTIGYTVLFCFCCFTAILYYVIYIISRKCTAFLIINLIIVTMVAGDGKLDYGIQLQSFSEDNSI